VPKIEKNFSVVIYVSFIEIAYGFLENRFIPNFYLM